MLPCSEANKVFGPVVSDALSHSLVCIDSVSDTAQLTEVCISG